MWIVRNVVFVVLFILVAWATITDALAQERNYTLTVTQQELQVLGTAIQELPKKLADPLLAKLQAQVIAQDKAVTDAQKPEDKK